MILQAAILAILLDVPVADADRSELWENRAQRLNGISVATSRAAYRATCSPLRWDADEECSPIAEDPIPVAADSMAVIVHESQLQRHIQAGECGPKECDPVLCVVNRHWSICHLARGIPQLHRKKGWSDEYWKGLAGLSQGSVDAQMWEATALLQADLAYCASLEGAFARYAKGHGCKWKGAAERAGLAREFTVRLRQLVGNGD